MEISHHPGHETSPDLDARVRRLRNRAFPEYAVDRSYGKQLPHLRFVATDEDAVTGTVGVDYRVVSANGEPRRIFGLIDLCVEKERRSKGIGTALIRSVERLAHESGIDALMLVTGDERLYRRNGFYAVSGTCTWLRIDEHESHGIANEDLSGELMAKHLRDGSRITGPVDFLGYLF